MMRHVRFRRVPPALLLTLVAWGWLPATISGQEVHKFGETVALGSNGSLVVTRRDVGEFRSMYPSEFGSTNQNVVAFELRFGGEDVIYFATDRGDPSRSDIVALCGTQRINIWKAGSKARSDAVDSDAYSFGLPGAFQAKDGRWGGITSGNHMPTIAFFSLPSDCAPERAQLLVTLEVGSTPAKTTKHHLLLTDGALQGCEEKP